MKLDNYKEIKKLIIQKEEEIEFLREKLERLEEELEVLKERN
jgi:hypothetical protein